MDITLSTAQAIEYSSPDAEIAAMFDCFDPSDAEMFEFLDENFSDAVETGPLLLQDAAVGGIAGAAPRDMDAFANAVIDTQDDVSPLPYYAPDMRAPTDDGLEASSSSSSSSSSSAHKRPRRGSLTTSSSSSPPSRRRQRLQQENDGGGNVSSSSSDGGVGGVGGGNDDAYNEMLRKLATSMKRSEASRANVLRQRPLLGQPQMQHAHQQQCGSPSSTAMVASSSPRQQQPEPLPSVDPTATVPQLHSIVSLSGFFSGQRSTLTSGLEQSRKQLQAFSRQMTRMGSL